MTAFRCGHHSLALSYLPDKQLQPYAITFGKLGGGFLLVKDTRTEGVWMSINGRQAARSPFYGDSDVVKFAKLEEQVRKLSLMNAAQLRRLTGRRQARVLASLTFGAEKHNDQQSACEVPLKVWGIGLHLWCNYKVDEMHNGHKVSGVVCFNQFGSRLSPALDRPEDKEYMCGPRYLRPEKAIPHVFQQMELLTQVLEKLYAGA